MTLSPRARKALEILTNGGEVAYRLERNSYTRREQFQARLKDAAGNLVRGFSFATYYELRDAGLLVMSNSTSVSTYYRLNTVAH